MAPDPLVDLIRSVAEADMARHGARYRPLRVKPCPRCLEPIRPCEEGPSFDHPGGRRVLETFGDDGHCISCEWDAPTFSPVNREVLS